MAMRRQLTSPCRSTRRSVRVSSASSRPRDRQPISSLARTSSPSADPTGVSSMRVAPICRLFVLLGVIVGPCLATAQTFNSGSTGADGAFAPTASVQLPIPPDGVFNFTTIHIPAVVTVSFATRAGVRQPPISLLATGNVVVAGRIDVSAGSGGPGGSGAQLFGNGGVPGPGGFAGGAGSNGLHGG